MILQALAIVLTPPAAPARIAYESDRDGTYEIYAVNPDGSDEQRLTHNSDYEGDLAWSPDHRKLAFSADPLPSDYGSHPHICVIDADGSGLKSLTKSRLEEYKPEWSPDGRRILFLRGHDLWIMKSDGTDQKKLAWGSGECLNPKWSPDGKRIVFEAQDQKGANICTISADGRGFRRLTHMSTAYRPKWSPAGDKILFGTMAGIYVIRPDGSGLKRLTGEGDADYNPVWSPDGSHIAFDMLSEGRQIWTMKADGSDQQKVSGSLDNCAFPLWSRDGSQIMFGTGDIKDMEQAIWLVAPNGDGLRKLTHSPRARSQCYCW